MLLVISIISLVVMPVLINKTTERHLDWIKPYLRQAWCVIAILYVVYFLTTETAKGWFVSWHNGFGTSHPELAYVTVAGATAVIVPAYWWFMGKLLPSESGRVAANSRSHDETPKEIPKLLIRRAVYGAGPQAELLVT